MTTSKNLAFIGLGVMGSPMASHLAQGGHQVCVYNRTPVKAQQWLDQHSGHSFVTTPAKAAAEADIVLLCVGKDDDVREVITGPQGILQTLKAGSLVIDHTTASASLAQEMATACKEKQIDFLDAPVSGGQQGAENGQLTIMVGGEQAAFERGQPIMELFAKAVTHMGPAGSGQMTKMVNQICIGGLVQALAEGLNFAERAGLDQQKVIDVISQGAAGSWQMVNRHKTMINDEYEHGFAVDWMRKDLAICLDQARKLGAQLPVTALVDQFYAEVQNLGGGRWDTSSLLRRLQATRPK
ncbi:2-hydroxy-3-oxopropionate reductase [Marinospirillum celere]|uniref:2-hydroxy-3-oxopropionate reductase n=1 Tax=Marinospirillum celere TaxID=1122252 RepID=A0A1I1E460_9GAMM|nr:NAD(P)-dependent oxidoreductase [Marinospirillum celere]SFB82029.1 2-hydroxy-3-oxopropionate reductase [Marinospirillum celere]